MVSLLAQSNPAVMPSENNEMRLLFSNSVVFVSSKNVVKTVPECEERKPHKETERSTQLSYEGDGWVNPGQELKYQEK